MRKVARLRLQQFGLEVDMAENGMQALQKMEQGDGYALVLMDVAMPVMDGLAAAKEIRKREQLIGRHVPIIAVSAGTAQVECIDAGMDDFVCKPADYERILRRWLPELFFGDTTGDGKH